MLNGLNKLACEIQLSQIQAGEFRERYDVVVRYHAVELVAAESETLKRRRERFERPQCLVKRACARTIASS